MAQQRILNPSDGEEPEPASAGSPEGDWLEQLQSAHDQIEFADDADPIGDTSAAAGDDASDVATENLSTDQEATETSTSAESDSSAGMREASAASSIGIEEASDESADMDEEESADAASEESADGAGEENILDDQIGLVPTRPSLVQASAAGRNNRGRASTAAGGRPAFAKPNQYNPRVRAPRGVGGKRRLSVKAKVNQRVENLFRVHQAKRYIIEKGRPQAFDQVDEGKRVRINPAFPRRLRLSVDAPPVTCILTWIRGRGAAWMELAKLRGDDRDHRDIKSAIESRAKQWGPPAFKGVASGQMPSGLKWHSKPHQFVQKDNVRIGKAEKGKSILPNNNSDGENRFDHYLVRTVAGGYYNVVLNLPQEGTAPVATDTARPGERFFIVKGPDAKAKVPVFPFGKSRGQRKHSWVFGFIARPDANGNPEPDPDRRGWVPRAVLSKKPVAR